MVPSRLCAPSPPQPQQADGGQGEGGRFGDVRGEGNVRDVGGQRHVGGVLEVGPGDGDSGADRLGPLKKRWRVDSEGHCELVDPGGDLNEVGQRDIECEVDTRNRSAPWIRLCYTTKRSGDAVDYRMSLTTTPLPWGGERWWFVCPLVGGGKPCRRRCDKLYLPPGGRYFGCRRCHDLTYQSCRDSHQLDTWYADIGKRFGVPGEVIRMMFTGR